MYTNKIRFVPAMLALTIVLLSLPVYATSGGPPGGGPGFTTSAVIPTNQVGESTSIFDLQVQPGQTQDLVVEIKNSSNEEMTAKVETVTVSTSTSGDMTYSGKGQYDETLRFEFEQIARVQEPVIVVPPQSTKPVVITLTIPQEEFDGIVLGSIIVSKEPDRKAEEESTEDGGIVILNRFSEATAVRLTQKGNADQIAPDFAMGDAGLELVNHTAALYVDLRMTQPRIVRGLNVKSEIYMKGDDIPTAQVEYPSVEMAPNSVFKIITLDNEAYGFEAGDYVAKMQLEWEGQTWDLEKEFYVDPSIAEDVNANAANQMISRGERVLKAGRSLPLWAIVLIVIGSIVVIAGTIMLLVARANQKSFELYMQMYHEKAASKQGF